MSETEIKEEEVLAEAPNVVTKDAEKAEPTHLSMTLRIWVRQ